MNRSLKIKVLIDLLTKHNFENIKKLTKINWWLLFYAIIFLGITLRIIGIYNFPIIFDEIHPILLARSNDFLALAKAAAEGHPPLYFILLHFWQFFSQDPYFARLLSFIFGILTIISIGLITKKLFNPNAGLISAFLLAISPSHIYFSSIGRMYTLTTLEAIFVIYFFINFIFRNTNLILFIIAMLIALYTHFFFIFFLFLLNFYLLLNLIFKKNYQDKFKKILLADIFIFLCFIPAIVLILVSPRSFAAPYTDPIKIPLFYINSLLPWDLIQNLEIYRTKTIDLTSSITGILAIFSLVLLFWSGFFLRKERQTNLLFFVFTIPAPLLIIFSYLFFKMADIRSYIVFSPLFFMIIAKAISHLSEVYRTIVLSLLGCLIFLFLIFYSLTNFGSNNLFNQIYSHFDKDDTVIYNDILSYLPSKVLKINGQHLLVHPGYLENNQHSLDTLGVRITKYEAIPKHNRLWYLKVKTSWPSYDRFADMLEKKLNNNFREVKRIKYYRTDLILYQPD